MIQASILCPSRETPSNCKTHLKPWAPWNCSTAWSACSTSPAWKGAYGSRHSRTVASVEQDTARSPDGAMATPFTAAVWPAAPN
jgi:hypothetical protein